MWDDVADETTMQDFTDATWDDLRTGLYGLGRCARCGESFREGDAQAEVTEGLATTEPLPALIVHQECMREGDALA